MGVPSPRIGQTVSQYRILEKLGEGGMGVVYLAEDSHLGRKVALKLLPPEAAADPARRRRFEQEARAAAALLHPGIATVFELGKAEGELYIVFEYVPGQTLRTLVRPGGLERDLLLDVAVDIAQALEAAHATGVVHRDLKPENVMRTPDRGCKILDFGLARFEALPQDATTATHLTRPGLVVGTVGYMSPEQLEGREVDFRSDLFSFGTLLYELATGAQPFQKATTASTIAAIMTADPPPLRESNPLHPPELDRIVRKCLRKRRDERYQSTRDLVVDLRTLKRESGEQPSSTVAPAPVASEDRRLSRIRLSWNIAQIFTLLVTGPLWIYLAWWGSSEAGVSWAKQAFIAVCVGVGINIASRVTFLSFALLGIPDFPFFLRRNFFWQRLGLWLAAPALTALAVPLAEAHLGLAATLAAIGLMTLAGGEVVEPAFLRAAFPQAFGGATETAKPKRDRRFMQIAAAQGVMLWMYFVMLLFAAGFGYDIVNTELLSGVPGRAVPYMLAVPILTATLVSSAALVARSLQQSRQALRVFLRLFPLYWLLGQAYAVPAFWMTNRPDHPQFGGPLLVAAVLVIPLAILPFYQRRLSRELLHESGEFTEDARTSTPPVKRPLVWWWAEVIFVSVAYLFMPFFAWWVRNNATDWWQTGPNNLAFVALLVCVMVPLILRVITMETAFFTPQELAERVHRFAPAIRFFTYSHAVLVAIMAIELTVGRYPLLVPVLWMMAAGIIAWGLVFEPIVGRAAFPPAAEAASRPAGLLMARRAALAGAQVVDGAIFAYWAYQASEPLERVTPDPGTYLQEWLVFLGLLFVALTHAVLALDLWSNGTAAAERLRRWFPLYLLGGILAAPWGFVIVARAAQHLVPAFAALAAVVALPFFQRHLAGQLLGPEAAKRTSGLGWLLDRPKRPRSDDTAH